MKTKFKITTLVIALLMLSNSNLKAQWRLTIQNTAVCSTMTISFFDVNNNPTGNSSSYALPAGYTSYGCQCTGVTPSYAIITEGTCSVRINVATGQIDCTSAGGTCGCSCLTNTREFDITSTVAPACSGGGCVPGSTMEITVTII